MYVVKSKIYLDFSKTQKSALCNYLRAFVKKNDGLSIDDILDKFIDDEVYYFEVGNPHFEFLHQCIYEDSFRKETRLYISECVKYFDYKKAQAPIIAKQKEFEKKKRKFLQEVKMSKEEPTKKQLYYYESLCKKYSIEKKDVGEMSKLDIKNEISEILDEHTGTCKNID